MKYLISALLLTTFLAGCSSSAEDNQQPQRKPAKAVHQPLDKAKGVEQQILDNAAEQRKQIDGL